MGTEFSRLTQENQRSIKCYLAVNRHLQQALLDVVHDPQYDGIPVDPVELYKFFNQPNNIKIINNLRKKVLKPDQISLLLPQNQRTFSSKWDITLICVVIINFTTLPEPINGWKRALDPNDISVAAFMVKARQKRNMFNHATLTTFLAEADFQPFFDETRCIVIGLKYNVAEFDKDMTDNVIDTTLFKKDVETFMNTIITIKERENVLSVVYKWMKDNDKEYIISEVLNWLKEDNEKGDYLFKRKTYCINFIINVVCLCFFDISTK